MIRTLRLSFDVDIDTDTAEVKGMRYVEDKNVKNVIDEQTNQLLNKLPANIEFARKEGFNEGLAAAAKIARGWPCYHNHGACGPAIANEINSLKVKP